MKLITSIIAVFAVAIAATSWKYAEPFIGVGTTVLTAVLPGKTGRLSVELPDKMSPKQFKLLNFAFEVAKEDGYKNPRYLQGILMQESLACDHKDYRVAGLSNKEGDRYFGCGQIKLAAAKDVMKKWPEMWDHLDSRTEEELQARLILDDQFNIRVASKYALLMGINHDPARAITRYNLGEGGAQGIDPKEHRYTTGVKKHVEKIKSNVPPSSRKLQSKSPSNILGRDLQVASKGDQ